MGDYVAVCIRKVGTGIIKEEYGFSAPNDFFARTEAAQIYIQRYSLEPIAEVPAFPFVEPTRGTLFPRTLCLRKRLMGSLDTLFEEVDGRRRVVN